MTSADILERLSQVIATRKPAAGGDPNVSYVARLFDKGEDAILKKIGEEATETVMAGKDGQKEKIIYEMADLWFHCLIALSYYDLAPQDILDELARREGLSGLEEFALRKIKQREEGQL